MLKVNGRQGNVPRNAGSHFALTYRALNNKGGVKAIYSAFKKAMGPVSQLYSILKLKGGSITTDNKVKPDRRIDCYIEL